MFSITTLIRFHFLCIAVILGFALYSRHRSLGRNRNIFSIRNNCALPPHPSNGLWSILYQPNKAIVGTNVSTGTILHIYCNETYKLNSHNMSICVEGNWFPEIGKCLKTCPSMFSTSLMKVRCSYDNKVMKSCEDAVENTQVQFICAPYYEDERSTRIKAMCRNGQWSQAVPQCVPVCGRRKMKKATPLIINGTVAEIGEFPWQVAIYRNERNICGGTLLHERLILTAAHCLSNETGKIYPIDKYKVIVGSIYRNFTKASQEENAQSSTVHAIFVSEGYVGSDRLYYGDIALIVPTKIFQLSSTVQPICIDWTNEYESNLFYSEKPTGIVSGWGYTIEYCKTSNVLRSLEVPIIERENCTQLLSKIEYQEYITQDKICAGFINKSKSVCQGDSGSGLIFNHRGRYYIIGIVSISLRGRSENGGCDSQNLAFYTHVSKYLDDLIWEYYMRYKPVRLPVVENHFTNAHLPTQLSTLPGLPTAAASTQTTISKRFRPNDNNSDSCILPNNPKFGEWSLYAPTKNIQSKLSTGMSINSGTILKIKCQKGYKLDGDKMVACENGTWSSSMGQCLKTCPTINDTKNMNVTCFHKMGKLENCIEPVCGTTAQYRCAPFYENIKIMEHPLYCMNGTWSPDLPQCVPKCGHKSLADPVYGEINSPRDFPWIVAIYRKLDNEMICTGNLLNEKIVLVSYKCLKEFDNITESLIIVAGNFFRKLDSLDSGKIQTTTFQIQDVIMQKGSLSRNLAFIRLKEPFQFSLTVQPVCVDWNKEFQKDNHHEGYISGWGYSIQNSQPVTNNILTTVKVDILPLRECKMNLPAEYMNTTEKRLCIRYRSNGTSSCIGEEGGVLFTKHKNRYYIFGVMDVPNTKNGCVDRQYQLYTRVYIYMDTFLATVLADNVNSYLLS